MTAGYREPTIPGTSNRRNLEKDILLALLFVGLGLADDPWSPAVKAADVGNSINEGESCIAFDGDYVYTVCNVAERSYIPVIPYGRSTDGGASWTTTWWVDSTGPDLWHSDPVILTDDTGYVHLFVQFSTDLLRHYLSTDHGVSWCDTADVSVPGEVVDKPWACYYGNEIYVCWQQLSNPYGIAFAKSVDGGRSWNVEIIDDRTYITGIDVSPSGILYISLRTSRRLYAFKSTDGGETWPDSLKRTIDTNCSYEGGWGDRAPLTCISAPTDDNVIVTVVDDRNGDWDILFSRSTDGGNSWTALAVLNDSTAGGQCKGWLEADAYGGLHVLWYHTPSWPTSASSWWSVRYQYSDDYGATFRPSIRLNDTVFQSPVDFMGEYHVMQTDSEYIRCVWTDGREGDLDLWFAEAELRQIGVEERPFTTTRAPRVTMSAPSFAHGDRIRIAYSLRTRAAARIDILDAAGRRLRTLRLGNPAPGTHTVDVTALPRGRTLFARLTAGETVTRRFTLLP